MQSRAWMHDDMRPTTSPRSLGNVAAFLFVHESVHVWTSCVLSHVFTRVQYVPQNWPTLAEAGPAPGSDDPLDEPEAALSPKRQLEFLAVLHDYCKQGAQFVIATHSPIIMAYPDARIYVFAESGVREVSYQETEHYLVTRGFLVNPQRTLSGLLSDDEPAEPGAAAADVGM